MSKMQATMSLSYMKAEYIFLGTVTKEVVFQAKIFHELFRKDRKKSSIIYKDYLGAINLTKKPQISQRKKNRRETSFHQRFNQR